MARSPTAFISYRRSDHFMKGDVEGEPDFTFPLKIEAALRKLGYNQIFLDSKSISGGDVFEGRIHRAITECDLFVELIGLDWHAILKDKSTSPEPDILLMEVISALNLDKDITPLLVDGAKMPAPSALPESIEDLGRINAKNVSSAMSVDELAEILKAPAKAASSTRRLSGGFALGYGIIAALAWCITAVAPNVVGYIEFGPDAWFGLAAAWAGFFIWPIFFMPFILVALYKPMKTLVEAALNAPSTRDMFVFLSPLIAGVVFACIATIGEITPPQVPWTIHPQLQDTCSVLRPDVGPPKEEDRARYLEDRRTLATYGQTEVFKRKFDGAFWLKSKCWPNVFFYLTTPVPLDVIDRSYVEERARVVTSLRRYLAVGSQGLKGTDAPLSYLFWFYVASFFTIMCFMVSAILIAIIYSVVSIRRPRDGKIMHVPTEDAFLCLTYAFITLMVWTPFRISTLATRQIYTCLDGPLACSTIAPDVYVKDGTLTVGLLVAYGFLTAGMLWNHKRILIGFLGTVIVTAVSSVSYLFVRYRGSITDFTDDWRFWMLGSIVVSLVLIGLWYIYDPALVRLRDVRSAARRERKAARKNKPRNKDTKD